MDIMAAPNVHEKVLEIVNRYGLVQYSDVVIDFGCGTGALTSTFSPVLYNITCMNINAETYEGKHKFVLYDLNTKMPIIDNSVDTVLMVEVLEHLDNPRKVLEELYRIVKFGGIIVLTTPNIENWESRIRYMINGRFFSFTKTDMNQGKGYSHISPILDIEFEEWIRGKFEIMFRTYNRVRIPIINHNIQTNYRIFGEIKILVLQKV